MARGTQSIFENYIAGESITKEDLVYLSDSRTVKKAKANDNATMPCIGMALESASLNNSVSILLQGSFENLTNNTFTDYNKKLYVSSDTAGAITETPPSSGIEQQVGVSTTTDGMVFSSISEASGETGIQGDTGIAGPQGATGLRGVTGIQGIQGETGIEGETGIIGVTGPPGPEFQEFLFFAEQFRYPIVSDWGVNAFAPLAADSNNAALIVRLFDDTTEEGVGYALHIPEDATQMTLQIVSRAETAPGSSQGVVPKLYFRQIPDGSSIGSWDSEVYTAITIPTSENFVYDSETKTLSSIGSGINANEYYQFELTRDTSSGSDTLSGDWTLLSLRISFS